MNVLAMLDYLPADHPLVKPMEDARELILFDCGDEFSFGNLPMSDKLWWRVWIPETGCFDYPPKLWDGKEWRDPTQEELDGNDCPLEWKEWSP